MTTPSLHTTRPSAAPVVHASPNFVPLHGMQSLSPPWKCAAPHTATPLCVPQRGPSQHTPVMTSQMSEDIPSRHAARPSWHAPHVPGWTKCPAPHFTTRLPVASSASVGSPAPHVAPDRRASSAHRMCVALSMHRRAVLHDWHASSSLKKPSAHSTQTPSSSTAHFSMLSFHSIWHASPYATASSHATHVVPS